MSLQLVRGRFINILDIPSDIGFLDFKVQIIDNLINTETIDSGNATASGANLIIEYDNENITPVGNNITIASAPNFTVQIGDVIRQGSVITNITAVTTQTQVTVADGTGLTAASATISQSVQTVNLNTFGSAADKTRPSDIFTGSIATMFLQYFDDTAEATGTEPNVAAIATADGFTNSSAIIEKPESYDTQHTAVIFGDPGVDLRLRFFSNITTGQGTVIFKGYKCSFHN